MPQPQAEPAERTMPAPCPSCHGLIHFRFVRRGGLAEAPRCPLCGADHGAWAGELAREGGLVGWLVQVRGGSPDAGRGAGAEGAYGAHDASGH